MVEQPAPAAQPGRSAGTGRGGPGPRYPVPLSEVEAADELRFHTGMAELDRVLGGGAVKGSLVLVGGGRDPRTAAKQSGVFWKAEAEFLRQLARWRLLDLDTVQPDLLEADRACKSTGSPDDLIAERAFMAVAGRARRLGL